MLTSYRRARSIGEAMSWSDSQSAYVAGGTDLVPLLRMGISAPRDLIDVRRGIPSAVSVDAAGGAVIGAGAVMADVAGEAELGRRYPVLVQALLASASAQVRNAATIGGNLLQRTRCSYFRDPSSPCNKRRAGSGCPAVLGENRRHAVIGGSGSCVAVHASDLAVALVALDASVRVCGPAGLAALDASVRACGPAGLAALDASVRMCGPLGERCIPVNDLYLDPGETPGRETRLDERELLLAVEVPPGGEASAYVKIRDRASFDFALVSAAAVLRIDGGRIERAAVALGGVAPRPWRMPEVERRLAGEPLTAAIIARALAGCLAEARPLRDNGFKIELARRAAARAIAAAGGLP